MEKRKETITVYLKTVKDINEQVKQAAATYKKFTVHKVNLTYQRVSRLNELFDTCNKWLQYYSSKVDELDLKLTQTFRYLDLWLGDWYRSENQNAGAQRNRLPELDRKLNDCYIAVLQIFIYNGRESTSKVNEVARRIVECAQYRSFPNMVCEGLEEIVKHANHFRRPWVDIKTLVQDYMGDHFKLFMPDGVNLILLDELKKICNLETNTIFLSQIPDFISCIYTNFESFRKIINRNYLYNLVAQGLEERGVGYPSLIDVQNDEITEYYEKYQEYLQEKEKFQTQLEDDIEFREFSPPNDCEFKVLYKLKITETIYQSFLNREYDICSLGLPESKRYMKDFLITLGKDSAEEFSNDITLPNLNDIDSIFAIMYLSRTGLFLMDLSSDAVIKMKLEAGGEIKLRDNLVIVLGKNHQFKVNIRKGIEFGGMRIDTIKLSSFADCQSTRTIGEKQVDIDNPLIIGRGADCHFQIPMEDIAKQHAEIYFNSENQSYMLKDLNTGSSTSYKLKSSIEIEEKSPSIPVKLEHNQIFFIGDFTFLLRHQN
jgi:hypothetical protein